MYPTSGHRQPRARKTLSPPPIPFYTFPFFSLGSQLLAMTSPRTPLHSRFSSASGVEIQLLQSPTSPSSQRYGGYGRRPSSASQASRSSRMSFGSAGGMSGLGSPRSGSRQDSLGMGDAMFSNGGAGNGLGNLADELADADEWDEDEEPDMDFASSGVQQSTAESDSEAERRKDGGKEKIMRDSGVSVSGSPARNGSAISLSRKKQLSPPKRRRRSGSEYEGSEYGSASELDETGLPPSLIRHIDNIDSLARRGSESNGGANDGVVMRLVTGLQELAGQAGVEMSASRLLTAHSAMSTHLLYQTKSLQTLVYPLIGPFAAPLDEETIEEILPLLEQLSACMPRPDGPALESINRLNRETIELVESLRGLNDSLHMSRQTTTLGARRLKVARELAEELRREEEIRDEGHRWVRKEGWNERLGRRECASACKDVLSGFEEVCEGLRGRLVALEERQALEAAA